MRPTGRGAVQADRAPAAVRDSNAQTALWRKLDYFATPPWAARACAEIILDLDPQAASVWEPACGAGHMADALRGYFAEVIASDVHDFGYGGVFDFLRDPLPRSVRPDWIFTNPPFRLARRFTELALERAARGVAILNRLQWIEAANRYSLFAKAPHKLTLIAPFCERVPMRLGGWYPNATTATAYALFVWMKGSRPKALRLIPPGTKTRLWRESDPVRWGAKGA